MMMSSQCSALRRLRHRRVILAAAFTLTGSLKVAVGEEVRIEGDAELLQVVRDAQVTAQAQYSRGSLVAEIHDEWLTSLHSHSVVKAVWEKDSLYWEAEYHLETPKDMGSWDFFNPSQVHDDKDKDIIDEKVIWIETPRMSCSYFPGKSAMIWFSPPRRHDVPIFQFHPKHVWLTYKRYPNGPFVKLFDPEKGGRPLRFIVRAVDDDHVVVEKQYEGGASLTVHVSLSKAGHVTGYEEVPSETDRPPRRHEVARYDWETLPSGTWVVREMEQTYRFPEKGDGVFGRYRMKLLDYDPDPEIPGDRFAVSSLKFAAGTRVTEIRGVMPNVESRSYRIGEDASLPQALLDRLAEELDESGFAKPKETD